ncbi:hypothetical protein IH824_08185 [candidate division KSB1 bacterium]|nr:hypothetical protein [candidate division KSB1 bacterium]
MIPNVLIINEIKQNTNNISLNRPSALVFGLNLVNRTSKKSPANNQIALPKTKYTTPEITAIKRTSMLITDILSV